MTEKPREMSAEELDWAAAHMSELQRGVIARRFRYGMLWVGLGIGLFTHVVGFLMKSSVTGAVLAVLADLLYTLGWALWTGVVIVSLVEVIPAAKGRQIDRAREAYEAALRRREQ